MRGADVGVVIIHGMGDPKPDFAQPLINGLSRQLGVDAGAIAFEPCFWSDILQEGQNEIWRRLQTPPSDMRTMWARKWIVGTLGDPPGYLSGYERRGIPVMHSVHQRLADAIGALEARVADPAGTPLVIFAHSLGGVVVTNYLWNLERDAGEVGMPGPSSLHEGARTVARQPIGATPMQRLETLSGLVTFGCNIPLFLPPTPPFECVRFPRPRLPDRLKAAAHWLNVYDPFDVLGYPLADLWDVSHGTVIHDVTMSIGNPIVSVTPFSHDYYWTDAGFHELAAKELRRVLAAVRS